MVTIDHRETVFGLKKSSALVHHITNWVTINDCAQITRHWGCLPVMAHAAEEVEEMVGLAGALVLNIGTLTPGLIDAMVVAARAANKKGIPVTLDAVGAGATRLRTDSARRLVTEAKINVVKGNAGEIATMAGLAAEVRGVESISVQGDLAAAAKDLAARLGAVVAVTGVKDLVSDGAKVIEITAGHSLMGAVVGTGCVSSSTVGCFSSAGKDLFSLTVSALACFGMAGERAARASSGPGAFMSCLMNEAARFAEDPGDLAGRLREL